MNPSFRKNTASVLAQWRPAILLVLAVLVTYATAFRATFVWDDPLMIYENPWVVLKNGLWYIWFTNKPVDYLPVTLTSFWVEWRLWGHNPLGYHITNILLFSAAVVVLWRVFVRLNVRWAWLITLVFAVHPVNVQSVVWIAERKNVLALLFYALTLLFYLRYEQDGQRKHYIFAATTFLFANLSKNSVVMLPVILLLLAWWQRQKVTRQDLKRSLPFFCISLVSAATCIWFQHYRASGGISANSTDFFTRLAGMGWIFWFYVYKAVLPLKLSFVYPKWEIDTARFWTWIPLITFVLLAALFWYKRRSWGRFWLMAGTCFVVSLFPVLGFFSMYYHTYSLVADHFQQLALPIIVCFVVGGTATMLERICVTKNLQVAIAAIVTAFLAVLTTFQCTIYWSREALWRDTLVKNPECTAAIANLSSELSLRGANEEAIAMFAKRPNVPELQYNWGNTLIRLHQIDEAMAHYEKAVELSPELAPAWLQLGGAWQKKGDADRALACYRKAIASDFRDYKSRNNAADLLINKGEYDEAYQLSVDAAELRPEQPEPFFNAGRCLLYKGDFNKAAAFLAKAIQLRPGYLEAGLVLGVALYKLGKIAESKDCFEQVLKVKPDHPEANYNLGNALRKMNDLPGAETSYRRALDANPDMAEASYQLGRVLAAEGRAGDAVRYWRSALQKQTNWAEPANELAWVLATSKDAQLRNGAEALQVIKQIKDVDQVDRAALLDTLAAACAETGDFDGATMYAERALRLIDKRRDSNLYSNVTARLALYHRKQPYRE